MQYFPYLSASVGKTLVFRVSRSAPPPKSLEPPERVLERPQVRCDYDRPGGFWLTPPAPYSLAEVKYSVYFLSVFRMWDMSQSLRRFMICEGDTFWSL